MRLLRIGKRSTEADTAVADVPELLVGVEGVPVEAALQPNVSTEAGNLEIGGLPQGSRVVGLAWCMWPLCDGWRNKTLIKLIFACESGLFWQVFVLKWCPLV